MQLFDAPLNAIMRMSATRANNRAGFIADTVTSVALISAALWKGEPRPLPALTIVVSGLVVFTFVEYCFHRWLFHSSKSLRVMEIGHRKHHDEPLGPDTLPFFLPPAILFILTGLFCLAMPSAYAFLLGGTIAFGYLMYGVSHSIIHLHRFRNPWIRKWAAYHHIHHFHPEANFGVTSPVWDMLLGTLYEPKRPEAKTS